ncbi:leucine-rich repeat-containing protein 20 isoform X3 [Phascolarctos cinereus]|uniref:Leucine-rich repeat-containing protein 20 isoform X3 n=1 Tax=Phascolarctos cinereus TaxID=38626 RepID=A0A6P5J936_PHACI|nr:leucine-rich repeat-containing protein 20 isoform X3 [Phascolarctos cinereus]
MLKKMGEAVARVARKVNETVENDSDTLELYLEGNALYKLPDEVSSLHRLKIINLSRNQFRDFPEKLTALLALETINLEENFIVDVPVEKLDAMPSLKCVNLRLNPLNPEVRVIAKPLISTIQPWVPGRIWHAQFHAQAFCILPPSRHKGVTFCLHTPLGKIYLCKVKFLPCSLLKPLL